jgi:hypothetical protein
MDVKALIVEQLDEDGSLRTLRMQPDFREPLIVAFGEEYNEPRRGPFHFLDQRYDDAYREGFATCRVRKVGDTRFRQDGELFSFETSWSGIPTQRNSLTYYALSLPVFAIPELVELADPHSAGKMYRKTVYRDDQRNRFVIYIECRSARGVFDFELRTKFRINPRTFGNAVYSDTLTERYERQIDFYQHCLPREQTSRVHQFFAEKIIMGDQYTAAQAGAMGPNAKASNMTFQQIWQQSQSDIDLPALAQELGTLRRAMRKEADEPSHDKAVAEVGAAEEAAQKADGPSVVKHLKNAGKWALDVATKIGVNVATEALKKSLG